MAARTFLEKHLLHRDALNRFWRAVYVAIGVNLITDVWPMVLHAVDSGVYDWHGIELAALRVVGQGAGAFLLRRFGDGSALPTPIPPSDPGEPAVMETPVVETAPTPIRKPRARKKSTAKKKPSKPS